MKNFLYNILMFCAIILGLSAHDGNIANSNDCDEAHRITNIDENLMMFVCPANEIITCAEYANYTPPLIDLDGTGCEGTEFEVLTEEVVGTCDSTYGIYITNTYVPVHGTCFDDEPCTQIVFVEKETIANVILPPDYDGLPGNEAPLGCSDVFEVDNYGNPSVNVTGQPGGFSNGCATIHTAYYDTVVETCQSGCSTQYTSYEIIRNWTIVDWCDNSTLYATQIIKIMDNEGPTILGLADMTVSTDPWSCGATIDLPSLSAVDNCSSYGGISIIFSSSQGTQVGNSIVIEDPAQTMQGEPLIINVTATDCCGNSTVEEIEVVIVDLVPPVNNAETSRTIELSTDGIGHALAVNFDDGSYDNCGQIGFFVRRMDNGGPCAESDYFGNGLGLPPNGVNDNAEYNEVVHFCCQDVGEPVMVLFQVCDDGDANGIFGTSGDNCNFSMVEVIVKDLLEPEIVCPSNMTISCVELAALGDLQLLDDDFLDAQFGAATGTAICNLSVSQTISGDDACGAGTVFRNFTATNSAGVSTTCTQFITISAGPGNFLSCSTISFVDLNNNIYNWCAVNDNDNDNDDDLPAVEIGCNDGLNVPELDIDVNGFCSEVGLNIEIDTFDFAGGGCTKYLIHYEVIDQCIFDENYVNDEGEIDPYDSNNGYFEFFLEVDAFDDEGPVLDCEDVMVVAQGCEGYIGSFAVSASDNCTSEEFISYQYRIDLYADNLDILDWNFGSEVTLASIGLTDFPVGEHIIYWVAFDGCGNDMTCAQTITVESEDKQPTPYCHDGLSIATMPSTGTVELWANDFDAGSTDNCTEISDLLFSMVPEVDIEGLSEVDAYNLSFSNLQLPNGDYGWLFDCSYIENGVSVMLEIRVYVTDENGNWDYCTATLRLDDNFNACSDAATIKYSISGDVKTEYGEGVSTVDLFIDANYPEFPMKYAFDEVYMVELAENVDYIVAPAKDDNHLNGITTLDIVLIQKHILGLSLIESPYTLIAADVDNNCQIDGADIINLRKLLLGKYTDEVLPNNSSWKFVPSDFIFPGIETPCSYEEEVEIPNLSKEEIVDFVGVKIGDVSGNAEPNLISNPDTRTDEKLAFKIDDRELETGERRIEFKATDFDEVYGFQFALTAENANFISLESGELNIDQGNVSIIDNTMRISKDMPSGKTVENDKVLFTLILDVTKESTISEIIKMQSSQFTPEAYVGIEMETVSTEIEYRKSAENLIEMPFALYQNVPNPFNESTTISFTLPADSEATLTIYDITGKVIYKEIDSYKKGMTKLTINKEFLQTSGVVYYQIESGEFKATKRMIILQ